MQSGPQQSAAPSVLEAMAALAHSVQFEELPNGVIAAAKARVLDTLGCAFGALHSDVGRAVRRMTAECGGAVQCNVPRRRMHQRTFPHGSNF